MISFSFHRDYKDRYGIAKQVLEFVLKLQQDPSNPSLHIEPIKACRDPRVRTGRINSKYRAVLFDLQGKQERRFVLVDVLNHDEAYEVAAKVQLKINPTSGVTELLRDAVPDETGVGAGAYVAKKNLDAEIESRARKLAAEMVAAQAVQAQAQVSDADAEQKQTQDSQQGATPPVTVTPPAVVLGEHGVSVETLVSELGIAENIARAVFTLEDEHELENALADAPAWQADAIVGLMAGMSVDDVREELQLEAVEDESDEAIIASMNSAASRMEFITAPDEEELAAILRDGSFDEWRVFLHPSQLKVVSANHSGSAKVLGGAGTGKTVVLVHRTKHLLDQEPNARVLLTTYTRKLANSLKRQMNLLDPAYPEASTHGAPGLWISGIDALVRRVLDNATIEERKQAMLETLGVPTGGEIHALGSSGEMKLWRNASVLVSRELREEKRHPEFLSQEYSAVILTQNITTESAYLRAKRIGRGTQLSRSERKAVWSAVQAFISDCVAEGQYTYEMLAAIAANLLHNRARPMFDHVLVDEAQDFHAGHWRFLRECVGRGANDIFIAEDSHQRIYRQRVVLSHFGIETRGRATQRLTVNYRTTAETLGYASAILEGAQWVDSDEQLDNLIGYRSVRRGPQPIVIGAADAAEEAEKVAQHIAEWIKQGGVTVGVLTRTNGRRAELESQLQEHGIHLVTNTDHLDTLDADESAVCVMTMHNAKGLEFTHVALVDAGAKAIPQRFGHRGLGEPEIEDALLRERALLYVAASRARDQLLVSYIGEPSELLPGAED